MVKHSPQIENSISTHTYDNIFVYGHNENSLDHNSKTFVTSDFLKLTPFAFIAISKI
jgi:hypothetical protein